MLPAKHQPVSSGHSSTATSLICHSIWWNFYNNKGEHAPPLPPKCYRHSKLQEFSAFIPQAVCCNKASLMHLYMSLHWFQSRLTPGLGHQSQTLKLALGSQPGEWLAWHRSALLSHLDWRTTLEITFTQHWPLLNSWRPGRKRRETNTDQMSVPQNWLYEIHHLYVSNDTVHINSLYGIGTE